MRQDDSNNSHNEVLRLIRNPYSDEEGRHEVCGTTSFTVTTEILLLPLPSELYPSRGNALDQDIERSKEM
jgi:hypothetical protein